MNEIEEGRRGRPAQPSVFVTVALLVWIVAMLATAYVQGADPFSGPGLILLGMVILLFPRSL